MRPAGPVAAAERQTGRADAILYLSIPPAGSRMSGARRAAGGLASTVATGPTASTARATSEDSVER